METVYLAPMLRLPPIGLTAALALVAVMSAAQSSYVQPRSMTYDLVDRYRVLYDVETPMVMSTSNFMRQDVAALADTLYQLVKDNDLALYNTAYLIDDNLEHYQVDDQGAVTEDDVPGEVFHESTRAVSTQRYIPSKRDPILKHFYKHKATFLDLQSPHFWVKANPILDLSGGFSQDTETSVFTNTRGVDIRGMIDNKIYFYTSILETQRSFFNYQNATIAEARAIPGNGLYKGYRSSVAEQLTGFDYLNATAYIGVPVSKHVGVEMGHGTHFLGNGHRSLLLSDFANNYFYVKLQTRVWKFQLQNIFAELAAVSNPLVGGDGLLPKKYFAAHYLTYKPSRRMSISLFETVVFSRESQYELQYLNPIILYRTVEHFIGSPDNVMLGIDLRWDLWKRVSLYGQLILDEFNLSRIRASDGWWANKVGIQAGVKYFDALGVDHWDVQAEVNVVRPWTYSHRTELENIPGYSLSNYTHYNQPLAHPLGANFAELILLSRYQPSTSWIIRAKGILAFHGRDTPQEAFGGNIFRPSGERLRQVGYGLGDGNRRNVSSLEVRASYVLGHNYFIDITGLIREQSDDLGSLETLYVGVGLRANIAQMPIDY